MERSEPKAAAPKNFGQAVADNSGFERAGAWRLGLEISRNNWLTGIGYAVYRLVEPRYTAPHSLLLKRWAESGILGAISIVLLAAYAPWRLARMFRHRQPGIFEIGCLVGVSCFFLQAFIFGADLSMMGLIVWGYGVGLLLAVGGAEPDDVTARRSI